MAKTGFLNALTIIGYVFVGLFTFMAIYLGIAYATGYFNPQKEPVVGLKFADPSNVVISENGGTYTLKIVSSNATIETDENGNTTITDTATPTDVRLTVRNSAGLIDNSIISVPEIVKTGEEFVIQALIDETDGYDCNVGGDCYINAETVDGMYKSYALAVFVDVPIKEIQITAKNPLTNEPVDLSTANFIYDDKVQLVANVLPSRALNPHTADVDAQNKIIEFSPGDASRTMIEDRYNGLVKITYNPSNVGDEPVTEALEAVVTATTQSVYDTDFAEPITQDCTIRLFPIQLEEILIQNKEYADTGKAFETTLLFNDDTNGIKFSAVETGLPDVINLDIFLKPTIYNPDNNADPLALQLNNLTVTYETTIGNEFGQPIDIIRETVKVNNVDIPVWTIKPLRTLEPNEEVNIIFNVVGHSETKAIRRLVDVKYNIPENFVFTDANGAVIENNVVNMTITKGVQTPQYDEQQIYYNYDKTTTPTFSKFVFFVNNDKKTNETGSLIINVNDAGQVVLRNGIDTLNARGAGTIQVTPYVVRTNADGVPVDCFYNELTEGTAYSYVFYDDRIPFTQADANKYVVYKSYSPLTVNVKENLTNFTIFSSFVDGEFSNELNSNTNTQNNPLVIGTKIFNSKRIYAVPNSALSIPAEMSAYADWKEENGDILFNVQYSKGEGLIVPSSNNTTNFGFGYVGDSPETYQRYMWFDVYTTGDEEILGAVTLYNSFEVSLSQLIHINAQNVPIANIAINQEGTAISDGYGAYGNIKYWQLDLHISQNTHTYLNKNYLRVNWTQQIGGKDSQIVLPEPIVTASDEWQARGCKPSEINYSVDFYAFDISLRYNLSEIDENLQNLSILDVLNYQTDTSTETGQAIFDKKWEIINSLLSSNQYKNKHAKVENLVISGVDTSRISTIQFMEALGENQALFMVYSVTDSNSDALPDFVRIDYRYPTVKFLDNSFVYGQSDEETGANLLENGGLYNNTFYYYTATFKNAVAYDLSKYNFTEDSYNFSDNTVAEGFSLIRTDESNALYYGNDGVIVADSSEKKFFNFVTTSTIPEMPEMSGDYYSISLKNESYQIIETGEESADTEFVIVVNRTVNVVSDVIWTDDLWESDLTSVTDLGLYFNYTKTYSETYNINFIVKNGYIDTVSAS